MSMAHLKNSMRAQANLANQSRTFSRLGEVSAYDPNTYSVKVTFQPDGNETGWIPLGTLQVGSGFGIYAAPNIGDQIEVRFQEGDRDTGVAGPVVFDNQSPPAKVPAGEIWVLHKSGAFFKLTNDGKAAFNDGKGGSVTLNGDGTVTSTGAWTHQGSMHVTQTLQVDQQATLAAVSSNGHDVGNTHKHTGVSTGSGVSGQPQ
ncbi:phage baseplate assembly protein V [Dyella halodurans]|uniref:Phage baseplate assembly protein V n=1 Tax=Dyella halodurans TaxID=1920171 RepID=A0ABV9C0C3_9GAMM|nr:phage baseplate assembly protein V [Dyella halodurans]